MRATKIVATLGPGSDARIADLVAAGVDVFRVNFSHGTHEEHAARVASIRAAAGEARRYVAILADLQGPKIRVTGFGVLAAVDLEVGASFAIDAGLAADAGSPLEVGTTYPDLTREVEAGDVLALGDGLIELEVRRVAGSRVECVVLHGGELGANKGINKRGGGLSAPALTDKDRADLEFACRLEVDYIAVSFPRSAQDMMEARALVLQHGARCDLVAKLERAEAVADAQTLDELIEASDAVMVARGDLGVEIGDAELMGVQKRIIFRARQLNRSVITATQMMESMITSPRPTRAEVMDVANAVLDGTDAVMLSGETAVGEYPVEAVLAMASVIRGAEESPYWRRPTNYDLTCQEVDESVALAAMMVAENLAGVAAVVCLTASGRTPQLMSRIRARIPIYAVGDRDQTLARVALYRGVFPVRFEIDGQDADQVNAAALRQLSRGGIVSTGDRVIVCRGGYHNAVTGMTTTVEVLTVE